MCGSYATHTGAFTALMAASTLVAGVRATVIAWHHDGGIEQRNVICLSRSPTPRRTWQRR